MGTRQKTNKYVIPSRTSPKGGSRGCICEDNTYDKDCCDGSIMAQGIGVIQRVKPVVINNFLLQENGYDILQENNDKIII